jgi:hypothetical protein
LIYVPTIFGGHPKWQVFCFSSSFIDMAAAAAREYRARLLSEDIQNGKFPILARLLLTWLLLQLGSIEQGC